MATRRLAKPRPVQGEAGSDDAARRGTGYAARAAGQPVAERDGHPRQNPAYRPATEKALVTRAFSIGPDSPGLDLVSLSAGELIVEARHRPARVRVATQQYGPCCGTQVGRRSGRPSVRCCSPGPEGRADRSAQDNRRHELHTDPVGDRNYRLRCRWASDLGLGRTTRGCPAL